VVPARAELPFDQVLAAGIETNLHVQTSIYG
jgi:hypothetical protein